MVCSARFFAVSSEYEPLFNGGEDPGAGTEDLDQVRELFEAASRPYLRSGASWLAWALVLPAAALSTEPALARLGPAGVVLLWSAAILAGGAVEVAGILRGGRQRSTPLAAWVLRIQGNLSLIAVALSALLLWQGLAWALPGLWLLLLGHSFYLLGGIAFAPFRLYGLAFQLGGVAALWPGGDPLVTLAGVTAAANLWMAWRVRRVVAASRSR